MKILSAIASIIITAGSVLAGDKLDLRYDVDLTKIEKDSFFVTLHVKGIQNDTTVFQFASTAPGTYQVMDIGRFVGGFTAYDEKGRVLPVIHRSVNQYVIAGAKKLHTIRYQVEDSYDT
ncbi:MAG TPA: peptidase, partial [bacterium]|nr:peptidase [bacterium]